MLNDQSSNKSERPFQRNRRRQLLINPKMQLYFLRSWTVGVVVALALQGASLVTLGLIPPPSDRPLTVIDIYWILGASAVFLVGLAVLQGYLAFLHTHRIAGAAYRIETTLKEINKGKLQPIRLRPNDYLTGIVDEINKLVEKLPKADGDPYSQEIQQEANSGS